MLANQLLRASEVAKRLNISESFAYRLLQLGKIPTVRINKVVRVRECDLDEYIKRQLSNGYLEVST